MNRIPEFDSLRGYCALWVALVHLARLLVLHDQYWFPSSDIAVGIFFILSGYVITNLLSNSKEGYGIFLFRRFFRLAPVFVFFCLAYILHSNFIVSALGKLDTTQYPVFSVMAYYINGARFWYIHLPAHITMLHGLLDPWVPGASKAILPEGWSMTVEWQFYLFAPLLLLMIQKKQLFRLAMFFVVALGLMFFKPVPALLFTDYIMDFTAGIASCYFMHGKTERLNRLRPSILLVLLCCVFIWLKNFDIAIWCAFILFAYGAVGDVAKKLFSLIFNNPLSNFLGKISYSLYLCHMLVIFYVIHLLANYVDAIKQPELFYCIAMPLIIIIASAFSAITYHLIEKPAIEWSKRKARNFI